MNFSILFDLDGTLVDTPRAIRDVLVAVVKQMNGPLRSRQEVGATVGRPLDLSLAGLLDIPRVHPDVAIAVALYQRLFCERVLPSASELLFDGVAPGLRLLKQRGFRLGVTTNKVQVSADGLIDAAGLRDFFEVVIGADRVVAAKPDPAMVLLALAELGGKPEAAVLVGDTEHDLHAARAAGIRSVAVTYGVQDGAHLSRCSPDALATSFDEVVDLFESPNSPFSMEKQ